jgi:hypothetical protein
MAGAEEKTRSGTAGLRYLSLIAATLAPTSAIAGAWVAPERQQIVTSFAGEVDGVSFNETSAFIEVPVEPDVSVVGSLWVTNDVQEVPGYRGEVVLGLKQQLYQDEDWTIAVQGGALWQSLPPEGCREGGAEIRALAGRSFENSTFVNAELGLRALGTDCLSNRLDLTAGFRPSERWLAMGQIFYDAPHEGQDIARAQVTLAHFFRSGRGVQIGVRSRIDGGGEELALVVGMWNWGVD